MMDKNYEKYLNEEISEKMYTKFDAKFSDEIKNLNNTIDMLRKSIRELVNALNNEIIHYSKDLSVFKSQLLKSLEFIEIGDKFATVKLKGWFKQLVLIYRESELQKYNNLKF
jgi:hypothetical protein